MTHHYDSASDLRISVDPNLSVLQSLNLILSTYRYQSLGLSLGLGLSLSVYRPILLTDRSHRSVIGILTSTHHTSESLGLSDLSI